MIKIKISPALFLSCLFFLAPYLPCSGQCCLSGCDSSELKILSWNIYMLPRQLVHTGQLQRAREIVESLKSDSADIVVFEEAFDRRSRDIIRKGLKKYFPYESGNPTRSSPLKGSSGIWVISKIPLTIVKRIYFKKGAGFDRLASKGALLLKGEKNNSPFQIIATHLQAEVKNRNTNNIRRSQLMQISTELMKVYAQANVLQFVVGDMNTIQTDTTEYNQMLNVLNVKPCTFVGENNYSFDRRKNDIIFKSDDFPQLIDYILYNKKDKNLLKGNMLIKIFRKKWDLQHSDLSDHFAVLGTFMLKDF